MVLVHKKEITISDLSLQYGFNSNSSFTRTFKKFYGTNPTAFRSIHAGTFSKIGKAQSKNGQDNAVTDQYICNINNHKNWIKMKAKIEIKETPDMLLAYVTHIGHYEIQNTFSKLLKWATPKGLLENENLKMLTVYHDSFKITDPDKVRMSACILLHEKVNAEGEIGLMEVKGGRCITAHFEIAIEEFEKAWSSLFIWMSENGYKKADRNPYQIYYNDFNEHPQKISITALCIPIE